ncbi:MAG: RIP metalloprotease RseP [Patescibacteria group bacterium]|nr:RIP metalloprotease RseP [Patescibacteria group bacterium]MBU1870656.1 RIP metalloprotease RseP [Patescibacteria group bacterium]
MLLTIIVFVLVLSFLVLVHELGHFLVAQKFKVKAEEFGLGLPPRIFGLQTWKDSNRKWRLIKGNKEIVEAEHKFGTVYSLNWLPLGGFVKIKGQDGESKVESDSFASRSIWQRFSILSAGVTMNIILAMVLIIIGFIIGMPQALDNLGKQAKITDHKMQVVQVFKDSPAAKAGLKIGDAIISISNKQFSNYGDLQKFVAEHTGQTLNYQIKRGQTIIISQIVPEIRQETERGGVGIAITETGIVKYPWHIAIWQGVKTTFVLMWMIVVAFYGLIKGLIFGSGLGVGLTGPVGIAVLTGEVARMGIVYLLQFTALLSVNLAIINFLPFPALDGGRILFLIVEKIKGSPVKREIENITHNIGFFLLMLLILVVTYKDVIKFGSKFKMVWDKMIG